MAIAFEHTIRLNKAATALVTGVCSWTVYIFFTVDKEFVTEQSSHHLGELSQILFFLMGAMTIVELIDAHDGFEMVTCRIKTTNKRKLMWIIALFSFFFSAVLDNLTTTIVMIFLVRKLVADKNDRWMLAGLIVIAANAGGAWSPFGDVTTTMLWIGNQVKAGNIIIKLLVPSLICMLIPILFMRLEFKGNISRPEQQFDNDNISTPQEVIQRNIIFFGPGHTFIGAGFQNGNTFTTFYGYSSWPWVYMDHYGNHSWQERRS